MTNNIIIALTILVTGLATTNVLASPILIIDRNNVTGGVCVDTSSPMGQ